jgi:hypothetical protein
MIRRLVGDFNDALYDYNCHMPHVVYSLLATHRSHRIEAPSVAATATTGKPHACNLCHLDKPLGWTQAQLA